MKKILLFSSGLKFGGTERNTIFIAQKLCSRNYKVEICSCSNSNPLIHYLENSEVKLTIIPIKFSTANNHSNFNYIYNPMALGRLFVYIYKNRKEVLQFFGFPLIWIGGLITRIVGAKKVITTIQDQDVWKKIYHIMLDRIVYKNVLKIICDGEGCRQFAIEQSKTDAEKFITVYDGVNLEDIKVTADIAELKKSHALKPNNPVVGVIARLDVKKKGQDIFLKAVSKVIAQCPSAKILVVGDGKDRQILKSLIKELKLEQAVILTGFREDLANMIAIMDILVIPSNWESVPKVLLEAMSLGKPVVSTKVGDISEIVEDGKTGVLIPPRDEDAMAEAIMDLLNSPQKRERIGNSAREKVLSEYTIEKSIDQIEKIYAPLFQ